MIPLLRPRSTGRNDGLQACLPRLSQYFQIREIDESPMNPGDFIFPSLCIAGVISMSAEETVARAAEILLRRRRCLILVPQESMMDVQLEYPSLSL